MNTIINLSQVSPMMKIDDSSHDRHIFTLIVFQISLIDWTSIKESNS